MRPVNEKLRADLLEAGKREFMENGFRGASLKSIAASLGVTTGAIYRYYTDKEALFDELVREPAKELVERYQTLQQTLPAGVWRSSFKSSRRCRTRKHPG